MSVTTIFIFFFNDTATTEIYTLSLHDALPICEVSQLVDPVWVGKEPDVDGDVRVQRKAELVAERDDGRLEPLGDRKSTRLNSSHANISYAVFCLKKKNIYYTISYIFSLSYFLL